MAVRVRMTLLYGALFLLSGTALLGVTYLLVSRSATTVIRSTENRSGASVTGSTETLRGQPVIGHELLLRAGLALAIMLLVSLGIGWLLAGRVLRPLHVMTRRLETALDSHKRFVANAAHELRTPLTWEHALLEEALLDPGATVETYRAHFAELMTVSEEKARLLESLLALATSERGLDRREHIDLAALTAQVLGTGPAGLTTATELRPAAVLGDPALVRRLIANLVDNAISHNVPGGRLEVRTEGSALTVANTGPVIAPELVDRLLHPFQRLARTADDRHHGLGLSIVQAIAAAHGAALSVSARPGGGLTILVRFVPVV
ncbi:two-component sensor histidine kinase [Actinoplanes cyaneus]|uniref:histidine kinase n=1 Tax=Actinoplanes cyaneus TaxID=52696 RepID=A0A919IF87_9ACTN|nr:ATP-binding protein [Actinoplanes cyaneus]MCW2143560.1 Histidine kinase-, DNA gyrase B-, and HSP90-like ATPase [Actinoplanes cyaneus]GID62353.1 two-component sensor histidine kinase [Actinoplanes cyaneus]